MKSTRKTKLVLAIAITLLTINLMANCKSIETKVEVNSPPSKTWQAIRDFKTYKAWNPFVTKIHKLDDETLEVTLTTESGEIWVFEPKVIKDKPNHFIWRGRLLVPGIFTGEHEFKVVPHPKDPSKSVFLHNESFSGILVPFFNFDGTERSFQKMNIALKARVESTRQ